MDEKRIPPQDEPEPGSPGRSGPTALPDSGARVVAFVTILVAGGCGWLIGNAFAGLQCSGSCTTERGLGGLAGAVMAAAGVAVIAVLVLRAMGEWRTGVSGKATNR